jgi:nitroimidazol reductase NimA-like FMN-containing flavoprotein (pyridoxamine 5'-phosphate oxidase superfamily)
MSDHPNPQAPPHVLEYLRKEATLTVATATRGGVPHAATMVYVADGITLYFCAWPESTTARNIAQNPAVAFTVDEYAADWTQTRGVQGAGECQVVLSAAEVKRVVELFRARFPFLSETSTANLSVFRVAPSELKFIEGAVAGRAGAALGMEYKSSLAYSVFRDLPRQEVEAVAGKLETVQVEPGAVIVRQGAPADKFFIIVDGEVDVVREPAPGKGTEVKLATLGRGQFFGEVAILNDGPRTATVRARGRTTLLTMDRDVFRGLVAQSLSTTQDFDRVIRQRLADVGAAGKS